ncbi:hypothetical protein QQ045_029145 [Rhodiola kirilowii]
MEPKESESDFQDLGRITSATTERRRSTAPSVIVIGGGISGVAAAHALSNASFEVLLLESRDRLGGRIHTDYSFGCPVDMGASWLHGVCNENPLAPLIRSLGLPLYRTSGDNSVLYDHDLESYALFDASGHQVPQQIVSDVSETFKRILEEVQYLVSHWGTDPNSMGCYCYDHVGKSGDLYERLRAPLGNMFFAGEAYSLENEGSVHGAYSSGIAAAENCKALVLERLDPSEDALNVSQLNELLEVTNPFQVSRL